MNLFRTTALLIVLSLGLSGCSGKSMKERRQERLAIEAAEDRTRCVTRGFSTGTDAFMLCLDNSSILRQNEKAAVMAQRAANKANREKWNKIFNVDD